MHLLHTVQPASPHSSPLVIATLIILTSVVIIFVIYTIYEHFRTSPQDAATHAQLAGLRDGLSELERRQRKELRAQRRWTRGYVEERLREHCWLLADGESVGVWDVWGEGGSSLIVVSFKMFAI
jgi:hypothetical protein